MRELVVFIMLLAMWTMTGCSSDRIRAFSQGFNRGYNAPVQQSKQCTIQPMYGTDYYQASCQ